MKFTLSLPECSTLKLGIRTLHIMFKNKALKSECLGSNLGSVTY